jgi:hypothetical protein
MDHRPRPMRWAGALFAILIAAAVGFFAYNAGVAHGLAAAAQQVTASGPGAFPAYGWYRPWGFGFFFGPFFFFVLFVLAMRGLFWGRHWRRYGYGCGGSYAGPMGFDEWHRRAHERMSADRTAGPPHDDNRSGR